MPRFLIIFTFSIFSSFSLMAKENCNYYARISQSDLSNLEFESIESTKLKIQDEMGHAKSIKRLDHFSIRKNNVNHYYIQGSGESRYISIQPRGGAVYLELSLYKKSESFFNLNSGYDLYSRENFVLDIQDIFSKQQRIPLEGNVSKYGLNLTSGIKVEFHFKRDCFQVHPSKHQFLVK